MNHLGKIQEVVLWAMCGSFLPMFQWLGGNGFLVGLAMAFWLYYGLRLGAELCRNVHRQMMAHDWEDKRAEKYAKPPKFGHDRGGYTVKVYPLIEWLALYRQRDFEGFSFEIEGKAYQIDRVNLNAASIYANLEEITSIPSKSKALTDNRIKP